MFFQCSAHIIQQLKDQLNPKAVLVSPTFVVLPSQLTTNALRHPPLRALHDFSELRVHPVCQVMGTYRSTIRTLKKGPHYIGKTGKWSKNTLSGKTGNLKMLSKHKVIQHALCLLKLEKDKDKGYCGAVIFAT